MCGCDDSATPARDACRPAAPYAIGVSSGLKLYPGPHDSMQGFRLKGGVVTAPMDQPNTPDRPVSPQGGPTAAQPGGGRGGAMLLAAVDDWNALSARHSAHLRTVMQGLGRGTYVAAAVAAGTDVG